VRVLLEIFRELTSALRDLQGLVNRVATLATPGKRQSGATDATCSTSGERTKLGDDFLLSMSVGFNEGVLANIDSIDAALIGILGATVAFAVLTVDKIANLPSSLAGSRPRFLPCPG
jgi:hypothetical protein